MGGGIAALAGGSTGWIIAGSLLGGLAGGAIGKNLDDKDKAKDLYNQLLTDYPASLYSAEARKRFRNLRGDRIEGGNTIEREIK